jgi:DNA-binding GntR family transcriptional regulator
LCDIDQEIKNELNIQKKDNVIYFIKNYYKNNKIIIKQLTAVNKEMILEVNYEGFKKSINKEFSLNGLLVEKVLMNFKQKIDKKLKNSLKIIDYDENKYVLEKFFSYSNYY